MRFGDFLRATVLTCAAGASALIVATLASVNDHGDPGVLWVALAWWVIAALLGGFLGRGTAASESIAALLAHARTHSTLPELTPGRTFINRLWPLMLGTLLAAGAAVILAQVPAVLSGFLILGALAWRHQTGAVTAIEERDGVRFYLERTAWFQPIRLIRTPGLRRAPVGVDGAGSLGPDGF